MVRENVTYNTSNQLIRATIWTADDISRADTQALIVCLNGVTCHAGRFEPLAKVMTPHKVAIAGLELRGHGYNANGSNCVSFATSNYNPEKGYGWKEQISEIDQFLDIMKKEFPQAHLFLLGFSLGSFLIRDYLLCYPNRPHLGTILIGTGDQPAFLMKIMKLILKWQLRNLQPGECTDLVRQLSFGSYNSKFKPNVTKADWLTSNLTEIEKYIHDPLCLEDISVDLFYEMLDAIERTGKMQHVPELAQIPMLVLAGEKDPVGNMGAGVQSFVKKLKAAGIDDVTLCMYPDARHDLLHEQPETVKEVAATIEGWVCDRLSENH